MMSVRRQALTGLQQVLQANCSLQMVMVMETRAQLNAPPRKHWKGEGASIIDKTTPNLLVHGQPHWKTQMYLLREPRTHNPLLASKIYIRSLEKYPARRGNKAQPPRTLSMVLRPRFSVKSMWKNSSLFSIYPSCLPPGHSRRNKSSICCPRRADDKFWTDIKWLSKGLVSPLPPMWVWELCFKPLWITLETLNWAHGTSHTQYLPHSAIQTKNSGAASTSSIAGLDLRGVLIYLI